MHNVTAIEQAHRGAGRRRPQDHRQPGQPQHGLGVLRRQEAAGAVPRGQPQCQHEYLSDTIHLRSGIRSEA